MINSRIDRMNIPNALWLLLCLPLLLISCQETVVSPNGDGHTLKASIDGTLVDFVIEPAVVEYDESFNRFEIGGSDVTGDLTLLMTFRHDVDNDQTPVTVSGPEVTINLARPDGSATASYRCQIGSGDCRVTIDFANRQIVEGSFSGTLVNAEDESDQVAVTGGEFSVSLN